MHKQNFFTPSNFQLQLYEQSQKQTLVLFILLQISARFHIKWIKQETLIKRMQKEFLLNLNIIWRHSNAGNYAVLDNVIITMQIEVLLLKRFNVFFKLFAPINDLHYMW
jgi:hypothetical protein